MQKNERNIVKFSLDLKSMLPLSAEEQAQIDLLRARPDSEIDYSDIPELDDAFWAAASHRVLEASPKKQITLRLDEDILDFFKRAGSRYQTRINAVLRAYVETAKT